MLPLTMSSSVWKNCYWPGDGVTTEQTLLKVALTTLKPESSAGEWLSCIEAFRACTRFLRQLDLHVYSNT